MDQVLIKGRLREEDLERLKCICTVLHVFCRWYEPIQSHTTYHSPKKIAAYISNAEIFFNMEELS